MNKETIAVISVNDVRQNVTISETSGKLIFRLHLEGNKQVIDLFAVGNTEGEIIQKLASMDVLVTNEPFKQ